MGVGTKAAKPTQGLGVSSTRLDKLFRIAVIQIKMFSKFGVVGLVAAFTDIFLFNIFQAFLFADGSLPFVAKIFSVTVSTAVAWLGNRYWTFTSTKRPRMGLEALEFLLVAVGGLFISLVCLFVSHVLLGFTSLLADNISGNVIGLVLATAFRFAANQFWVFSPNRAHHKSR